jgi:hypothetical protein
MRRLSAAFVVLGAVAALGCSTSQSGGDAGAPCPGICTDPDASAPDGAVCRCVNDGEPGSVWSCDYTFASDDGAINLITCSHH